MISTVTSRPRIGARPAVPPRGGPAGSAVPFDYAALFALTGQAGNAHQDVITIAPDGPFVAVAIGYGLEEDRGQSLSFPSHDAPEQVGVFHPGDLTLGDVPISSLLQGFRVRPDSGPLLFPAPPTPPGAPVPDLAFSPNGVQENTLSRHFETVKPREEVSFLLSVTDSATGREFQDEPTHSLASLGSSDGRRPFRLLAHPVTFQPRTTLRFQVIERSPDIRGNLYIVLYGYTMFGATPCPPPLTLPPGPLQDPFGTAASRVVPFDYVVRLALEGRPGRRIEQEVPINAEGGYAVTAIGYGLEVADARVSLRLPEQTGSIAGRLLAADGKPKANVKVLATVGKVSKSATTDAQGRFRISALPPGEAELKVPNPKDTPRVRVLGGVTTVTSLESRAAGRLDVIEERVDLGSIPLSAFRPEALLDGIRIRPSYWRIALADNGLLADRFPRELLNDVFERINRPEEVSFRYTIFDGARGRDLQNRPIHNIAGLGIADGGRPFKNLARPLVCMPRASLRVSVEEQFGRGNLFLVFQGYKVLGAAAGGSAAR